MCPEQEVLRPLNNFFDALEGVPRCSLPPAQFWHQVIPHVEFSTQVHIAAAFGDVHSVESKWNIGTSSFFMNIVLVRFSCS